LGAGVEDRPEAAEAREEFGHWEIDSAVGKNRTSPQFRR
jgi:IS30 family transposase